MNNISDGPISLVIYRPLAKKIKELIVGYNITPNQITITSFVLACLASLCFFLETYNWLVIGGLLTFVSEISDHLDGEIARAKNMQSEYGGWLDSVLDRYADAFLLTGVTFHVYFNEAIYTSLYLLIGITAIIGSFMVSYTAIKYDDFNKNSSIHNFTRIGRDVRTFIIIVGAIINQPLLALIIISVLMNFESVRRISICKD